MLTYRLIAVAGSVAIALALLMLVLDVPARAARDKSFPLLKSGRPSSPWSSADITAQSGTTSSTLSCREGLAGWEPYLSEGIDIQSLGGGVYLDFSAHAPASRPNAMEFIQMIRIRQKKDNQGNYLPNYTVVPTLSDAADGLGPIIASAPGSLWLVGNEPDRGPNPGGWGGQDDTYPAVYARAYHDAYYFIKQRDPTASVANAGLVEVTPGRMQYLEIMWDTYAALYGAPMPVDVWNSHLYILPETDGIANVALGTDPSVAIGFAYTRTDDATNVFTLGDHDSLAIFDAQVRRMRQWMKAHGQEDKPLLLSEFGQLYDETVTDEFGKNFTMPRAAAFLTKTFHYLSSAADPSIGMPSDGNRLVQHWIWFSANNNLGHIGNLVTQTTPLTFTTAGDMFQASVSTRLLRPNLQPRLAVASTPILAAGESTITATLSVQVVNNGNQLVSGPVTVTFFSDEALTQVIDSIVIADSLPGCARRRAVASVVWPNRGAGFHPFWVKVDSSDAVSETSEADNIMEGQAFVGTHGFYLPLIARVLP